MGNAECWSNCVLCGGIESVDHLFFECTFAKLVWQKVQKMYLLYRGDFCWQMEVQWWSVFLKGKSFATQPRRLDLSATVWHLWQERNSRIFKQTSKTNVRLVAPIVNFVQSTCVSWESALRTKESLELILEWRLECRCLMS